MPDVILPDLMCIIIINITIIIIIIIIIIQFDQN